MTSYKTLLFIILGVFLFASCIMDRKVSFLIKNCTNDTLLIVLTENDTLDNCIYWGNNPEDTIGGIMRTDTIGVYINGTKIIIDKFCYARPDSIVFVSPYLFNLRDTCNIFAIKWWTVSHYTLAEIRKRKLYDRRVVTKKDFINYLYEYK